MSVTPQPPFREGKAWHTMTAEAVLQETETNVAQGLSRAEAKARLERDGFNELVEKGGRTPLQILIEQLQNPLVLLLIGASFISLFLGKLDSFIAILAIVILNAVLGVVQEFRAEQAMNALKKMSAPMVRVRRDGVLMDVEGRDLVAGDIVLLEAGSVVPADSRVIEAVNLRVQEASLTGESEPIEKDDQPLRDANAPLGDRHNMVFMGTSVTYGRGTVVVVETGMNTQLGRIADLIQSVEAEKTPLQRRLDELGRVLLIGALVVMGIAFVIGLLTGVPLVPQEAGEESVLLYAVAIAVAVVPEGLPAVVTIALALGAQRMLRRRALIRRLAAVETLGSVTIICSDKTGTLTQNRMTVTLVDVSGHRATMEKVIEARGTREDYTLAQWVTLMGSALCNDAILQPHPQTGEQELIGDPTEGALVVAAQRYGMEKTHLEALLSRAYEVPFDSARKRMTTVHKLNPGVQQTDFETQFIHDLELHNGDYVGFTKGAVDGLLTVSSHVLLEGKVVPMTPELQNRITKANDDLAQEGLRVLGLAYRLWHNLPDKVREETVETGLIFVGMIGMIDPPRTEVYQAVKTSIGAGIRPVMITGDHPLTAYAIAKDLGIAQNGDAVLTGQQISQLTPEALREQVKHVSVFARVSPEHKLNIVQALQDNGQIAAMTGDGVNDAPALKRSNIGVAMGITGTAVSKEASDMVLLDDNFATIVSAVEEGRTIYDNMRRFIKYLLGSNTGELFVLLVSQLISGLSLPLTTLQILWMNLVTDGIPALALGVEVGERGTMQRPPYDPNESFFGRGVGRHILVIGTIFGMTGVALGWWAYTQFENGVATYQANTWNTMVFMFLTVAQMGHALALRSHRESFFTLNFFGNRFLLIAVGVTLLLQFIAVYAPFFNQIFNTTPLTLEQMLICLALSPVVFVVAEVEKFLIRRGVLK